MLSNCHCLGRKRKKKKALKGTAKKWKCDGEDRKEFVGMLQY